MDQVKEDGLMELYSQNKQYKLYHGNMLDMLEVIEKESIDSIVTDPPYGLTSITKRFGKEGSAPASTKNNDGSFARLSKGFMGKEWDGSGIEYNIDTWTKCYEVLKPGGYLLAFGGSRTFHRIACAIEDAGFEVRDTIMWLYGSGFPKSQNIGKMYDKKMGNEREKVGETKIGKTSLGDGSGWDTSQNMKDLKATGKVDITKGNSKWEGWGSCLKPSFEPIIVARKPFKGSLVDNVIEYGVGGINIDECRVEAETNRRMCGTTEKSGETSFILGAREETYTNIGRFPANTILTYDETDFDEVCGGFPNTKSGNISKEYKQDARFNIAQSGKGGNLDYSNCYGDSGSASRYFYCAKASKKDRDEGLDKLESKPMYQADNEHGNLGAFYVKKAGGEIGDVQLRKNTHPTVKPTDLMQYLVRLVTPKGGTVLDPFNGSGSTGKAVMYENRERNKNYKYIGIELTEEYLPIAKARIEYVINLKDEELKDMQMSIFDL